MIKDTLSAAEISILSSGQFSSSQILDLKTVNSTNSFAKAEAIKGSRHEYVIIADKQTEGRGRLGKDFFSPEGSGIYMSIILDTEKIQLPASLLTIGAGVAVCSVLESICPQKPSIKWVNDIFLNSKKVCGILAESVIDRQTILPQYIVVGIGINVFTEKEAFPGKLKEIAGSVFPENITRNEIIAKLLAEFRSIYQSNEISLLIDKYKNYSLVLGKKISFTLNSKAYTGTATNIEDDGSLTVTLADKSELNLKSGEISLGSENFIQ